MPKIAVFIDVANQVDALALKIKGHRINYKSFLARLNYYGDIYKLEAFILCHSDESLRFIHFMRSLNYRTVTYSADEANRINPDLVLSVMECMDRVDTIILGTNDSSLCTLVEYLQRRAIKVIVITPGIGQLRGDLSIDLMDEKSESCIESIQSIKAS